MEKLSAQIAKADAELSDPTTYEQSSTATLLEATQKRAKAKAELARIEAQWLAKSEELERS